MFSKVIFEEKYFEIYVTSVETIVVITVLDTVLGSGIYFMASMSETSIGGRYIFISVLGFFFLALASSLPALIKNACNTNRELRLGANGMGLLIPAQRGKIGESNPAILYKWNQVKSITISNKQITDESGMGGNLLVVLDDLKFPNGWVFQFAKAQYRTKDGYYQFFNYPKVQRTDIILKLRELAPDKVIIEE